MCGFRGERDLTAPRWRTRYWSVSFLTPTHFRTAEETCRACHQRLKHACLTPPWFGKGRVLPFSDDRTKLVSRTRALRHDQTNAEAKLWRVLRNRALNGLKSRRQVPIDRYVADFACFEVKLVVEVDGATHSRDEEVARDAARTAMIEQSGFAVLRILNADIYDNLEGVRETILAAAERRDTV